MALPYFNDDVTVGYWDQVWNSFYNKMWDIKFSSLSENLFHVKTLTATEVIQKNVLGVTPPSLPPLQNRVKGKLNFLCSDKKLKLSVTTHRSSHSEVFLDHVLKICSKVTGEHPFQSVISVKLLWNFLEIALQHGCSMWNSS